VNYKFFGFVGSELGCASFNKSGLLLSSLCLLEQCHLLLQLGQLKFRRPMLQGALDGGWGEARLEAGQGVEQRFTELGLDSG